MVISGRGRGRKGERVMREKGRTKMMEGRKEGKEEEKKYVCRGKKGTRGME